MKRFHFSSKADCSAHIADFDLTVIEPTDDDYEKFYHECTKDWTMFHRDDKPGFVFFRKFEDGELTPVADDAKEDTPAVDVIDLEESPVADDAKEDAPVVDDIKVENEVKAVDDAKVEEDVKENSTTDSSSLNVTDYWAEHDRQAAEEYLRKYHEECVAAAEEVERQRREQEQDAREEADRTAQSASNGKKVLAIVLTLFVAVGLVFFVSAALGCIALGGPLLAGILTMSAEG